MGEALRLAGFPPNESEIFTASQEKATFCDSPSSHPLCHYSSSNKWRCKNGAVSSLYCKLS